MNIQEVIDKYFKDERIIWFDYTDIVKANEDVSQKGIEIIKKLGLYNVYILCDNGDSVLYDILRHDEGDKLHNLINLFR